jgi:hypothetical protein
MMPVDMPTKSVPRMAASNLLSSKESIRPSVLVVGPENSVERSKAFAGDPGKAGGKLGLLLSPCNSYKGSSRETF